MMIVTRDFLAAGAWLAIIASAPAALAQTAPDAAAPSPPAPAPPAAPPAAATPAPAAESSICTDRPTKAFATCVVDTGKFQVESDLFNGSFLRLDGVTTDTYLVTNPTLKYGLAKNLDIEVNIVPYEVVRTHEGPADSSLGGVGDLYLRGKYAAFTSSDGKFAVSLDPYVKAPTARLGIGDGAWEGGSALPISYKLSDALTLALAPELDDLKDANGEGHHLNHVEVINLGLGLPRDVTVYAELWGDWNYDPAGAVRQYSADFALAKLLGKTLQLDVGVNFGLNRYTPGVQAYFGVSKRF